ncbi:MAG: Heterocyst differentiation ATP-binding protein HepA [candidate division BRC1 bacterium ADurb.BinA364]|nr:MAG: Heterocyst differentiation ATP-binding protein HepA [candidate division BRC1 bacterium ADurb.BinA364]
MDRPGARPFPADWRELIFDDASLQYRLRSRGKTIVREALRNVSLRIRRGEAIALVGPNGAGKSSLVNLICRLYDPTSGDVRLDSISLRDIRLDSLRRHVCLIPQHAILFNRSVADNIAFGLEDVDRDAIVEAAKATNAHDFISQLPHGYDTVIGEQGRMLSGGERQKIALARAFVRRPSILILDEPTTGLDHASQIEFLDLVGRAGQAGATVIYITHKQSELGRFERIFVFDAARHTISEAPAASAAERPGA